MPLHEYRVGASYIAGRTRWPEGGEYNYRSGAHELRLFFERPSNREIEAIRRGPCEFALLPWQDALFFLWRFEGMPWSDKPYSWWLVPEAERSLPLAAEVAEPHDLLSIILVDAGTGLIRALRTVSFSPAFTTALRLAIQEQATRPFPGDAEYNRLCQWAYARYQTSTDMAKDATARTVGGRSLTNTGG